MRKLAGSVLAALVLAPFSVAHATLIVNGGFEEPDINVGTFAIFANIPGWSTTFGGGIEIQDHVAGSPYEGQQHVELDSINNSGMIQTVIPTVPGGSYEFRFAYSPRPGRTADDNTILVFFDGALLATLSQSGVGLSNTSWSVFDFLVVASSQSSSIEFRAAGPSSSFGGYLDAVSFAAENVPEPSALLFVALGLLGLAVRRRAR